MRDAIDPASPDGTSQCEQITSALDDIANARTRKHKSDGSDQTFVKIEAFAR